MKDITAAAEHVIQRVASRAPTWALVEHTDRIRMREYMREALGMTLEECMLEALDEQPDGRLQALIETAWDTSTRRDETVAWGLLGSHVTRITAEWLDRPLRAAYGPAMTDAERADAERYAAQAQAQRDREAARGMGS